MLYTLIPQDVLFFRDGRPMESAGGHGARWPEPSLIFDALHAALHRAFPEDDRQPWEHSHRLGRSSDRDYSRAESQRFGSLQTIGLFPISDRGEWLFPAPQDVLSADPDHLRLLQPLRETHGTGNLPPPLSYPLGSSCAPSKEEAAPWWTRTAFHDYLAGRAPSPSELKRHSALFDGEWTTGIGIDPETQTQDQERIYSAEYLRLREGVRLGFAATLPMKQNGSRTRIQECVGELFVKSRTLIVGGQQRVCSVEPLDPALSLASLLPRGPAMSETRVKWVLLSPAVFPAIAADPLRAIRPHPGGWLPNWVDPDTGAVLLKLGDTARGQHEPREAWRDRVRRLPGIRARLVAARIPKPQVLTGWSERIHLSEQDPATDPSHPLAGPRAPQLAVPAGAVYYFEADSRENAVALANALNWHGASPGTEIRNRRSTLLGEKGFGLGVCGTWEFYPERTSDPAQAK